MDSYSQKIRGLRKRKDMAQEEVASALGITRPTYNAIEAGKRELTIKELHKLCNLLGVTVEQFLFSSTQKEPYESRMTKYKQVILNCLEHGSDADEGKITKTKLAILVYMCDFASYYEKRQSLSNGLPYRHTEYGPIVDAYYRMIDELYDEGAITIELRGRAILIYANEPSAPDSILRNEEVEIIKEVCGQWRDKSTQAALDFVKQQTPWRECTQGEIIPYNSILEEPANPFLRQPQKGAGVS
jgi:transcriptional regulator with XRE-family HTH domain